VELRRRGPRRGDSPRRAFWLERTRFKPRRYVEGGQVHRDSNGRKGRFACPARPIWPLADVVEGEAIREYGATADRCRSRGAENEAAPPLMDSGPTRTWKCVSCGQANWRNKGRYGSRHRDYFSKPPLTVRARSARSDCLTNCH